MCKFKAERLIKEILIVRYIDTWGDYRKDIFAYRFLTEQDVENKITKAVE